ncbi:MAG: tail fiber protein [Bryobacteraceae bacterium]|jgi:microcystin-dependent protein
MEPVLGMIYLFAGNFAPVGYAICDGQLAEISQNPALFSVIGTTYGGNGVQNFALPKLAGPEGTSYLIAIRGVYPSRQ